MTDHSNWPRYESHKIVKALPIVRVDGGTDGVPKALFVAPNGVEKRFDCTEPAMTNRAELGWYAVVYADGFRSVSPKTVFEDGYTLLAPDIWQTRLRRERDELADRFQKLCVALDNSGISFPEETRTMLDSQRSAMRVYLTILDQRVDALPA